jgi:ACS family glucarate transporter-like MFS transporter
MTAQRPSPSQTHIRWFLVFWLFILSAVSFLDRVNISVAGASIASDYNLSNLELGFVFSAFLLGYALFQTPGGWLADKLGSRRVLSAGVLWWGIFTALTASLSSSIAHALLLFISIRFLLGAGEAIIYPASNQFITRWIPSEERGIANGWIFAGVGAGAGISPPLVTWVMVHYGWRYSFWMCAAIGLAAGAVWYLLARDTPEEHPGVSAAERSTIESGLTLRQDQNPASLVPWSRIVSSRSVLAVTTSYFCYGYVAWIFFSWFYIYLKKVRGLDLKSSALYGMLPFIAMTLCCLAGGWLNDAITKSQGKRAGRSGIAVFSMALTALFLILGSRARNAHIASVVLAGGAGALYLSQSSFWSVTADIGGASSGSVSGLMNMGAQLGGALTASLTPWIADHFGWTASFLVAAGFSVVGSLAWLLVDPNKNLTAQKQK